MLNVILFLVFVSIVTAAIYHLENNGRMDQRWAGICSIVSGAFLMSLVWADWGFGRLKDERKHDCKADRESRKLSDLKE